MELTTLYPKSAKNPDLRKGDILKLKSTTPADKPDYYIIGRTDNSRVQLFNLRSGNNWSVPVQVADDERLTREETLRLLALGEDSTMDLTDLSDWSVLRGEALASAFAAISEDKYARDRILGV